MNAQEAQQAQTIAGIKLWFSLGRSTMKSSGEVEARKKVSDLLKIVDSQAQKITELSALFQKAGNGAIDLAMKCSEQELKIAEQAKEIERLNLKKYTVKELAKEFDNIFGESGKGFTEAFGGWLMCARFLGVVDEETTDSKEVAR